MSQWKVEGAGECIPPQELNGTTLVTKHNNGPHTPTPTVSLYELSGQDHPFVPTTSSTSTTSTTAVTTSSSWSFDDQRRHKSYPTNPTTHPETATRSDGTMSYSLQVPGDKQLWSRQEKISITKRPIDHTSSHTNKDINAHTISSSPLSPTSSLHPLTNDYVNLHPDGSLSVRTTPSQVIPPVTLPTNHHQDHRLGNQGMVTPVDNKQQQQQQQQHHQHQSSIKQQQQYQLHSGHSHYSEHKDIQRSTKHPYSRSFSDTPHSLLPYHHPHSSQHRHNSIPTAEHTATRAAAVAAAYQSQSMNPSQMTWYTTFHQKGSTAPSSSTSTVPHPPLYNHSTSSSPRLPPSTPKCQNDSQVYQGSNYTPMSDFLASSRIDNVEYGISSSSSSSSATTPLGNPFLGQHRHSTQWTSSPSTTSSSPAPPSPRTNDMQTLLSMSFTPAESYNNKKNNDTLIMDQKPSPPSDQKKKQPKKLPTGKRRSPNAFFVFCSDRRQLLKQGRPNARNTDINKELGGDWNALTQEERDRYKDKADKIRAALPNDNTPTPKSMTTNLFSSSPSPFTYSSSTSSFDSPFNEFTPTSSRNNSLALTIAADDDQYPARAPKRSSLESDLYTSSNPSSSQQQHPLAVASLSGAAEADALDQAAFVGIPHKGRVTGKTARLKRPPNAYLLFNREMRSKLKEENDDLTVAAISKLISQSWRDLPQERKDYYRNEAESLKEQHMKNHPDYVYIRRSRTELAQAGYRSRPTKKRKKSLDDDSKKTDDTEIPGTIAPTKPRRSPDPRGRKKKKHKNPSGPKHPMSGFLYFASDIRREIVQQHPDSGVGVISKLMAERWRKLTPQEKSPWIEKADEDKARYAREVLAFKLAQEQHDDGPKQHTDEGWMEVVNPMKKSSISSLSSSSTTSTTKELDGYHPKPHCFYKPVSRIHSALTSSRPASPTELDSHTIQTVAQMVNPRNTATGRPDLLHRLATPSSLASIIHHETGNYQLHVPATPPSPAIDTI